MQVYCSNCNTPHTISYEELKQLKDPVINCSGCEKKIKMQFCPGCGAFYSVTFSNIQPGNYRYKCRKCSMDFPITIPAAYQGTRTGNEPESHVKSARPDLPNLASAVYRETVPAAGISPDQIPQTAGSGITFMQNSINTFTVGELFSITATSFSIKKIIPAAAAVLIMLLIIRIITMLQGILPSASLPGANTAYILFNLIPAAVLLSFYMVAAAVVSRVTLEKIFYNREPGWDTIAFFAVKKCPAIFICNTAALLLVNLALVFFGKIPMLGPLLFAVAFFPVYIFSIFIALLVSAGIWFYPPVTAHRESGMFRNLKDLLLFIKKHNLTLIYMIPVASMLALVTFAAVFIIHSFALTLTLAVSKAVLSGDAAAIFSGIPVIFVKTSEAALSGINGTIFRELSGELTVVHRLGGMIIGASMTLITVLLASIFFSITATISTHIYIMMERGLTVDDKRKALTMFILFMFLAVLVMARRMV
ncbi:MAG TPA: hypothetical protein PK514_10655 [Spirochaetota bacterium]|nr:hypothetical protein [Spirochaetota bacterium]